MDTKSLTSIDHHVHGSSGEQSGFAWGQVGRDEMSAILFPHIRCGIAHRSNDVVGSTRM